MSQATSTEDSNASRPPAAGLAVSLFVIFVLLRLLLAEWQYFWEQDDISIAAGVAATLLILSAWRALRGEPSEERVAALGESYLFLLHEPEGFGRGLDPAQHAALVERYAGWARDLGARCLGGEELD